MTFIVQVYREWKERGSVNVEAASAEEAKGLVRDMLCDDDEAIEWEGSNMEWRSSDIEGVRKAKEQS